MDKFTLRGHVPKSTYLTHNDGVLLSCMCVCTVRVSPPRLKRWRFNRRGMAVSVVRDVRGRAVHGHNKGAAAGTGKRVGETPQKSHWGVTKVFSKNGAASKPYPHRFLQVLPPVGRGGVAHSRGPGLTNYVCLRGGGILLRLLARLRHGQETAQGVLGSYKNIFHSEGVSASVCVQCRPSKIELG